jgi:cytochrome c553
MATKAYLIAVSIVVGVSATQWPTGAGADAETRRAFPSIPKPHDNRDVVVDGNSTAPGSYGGYSATDVAAWERETYKLVLEGARVFHDANAIGSGIGMSCGTCHPDGAGTHPETYPKYQVQIGRAALLRDMIDWCSRQSARGAALGADDPRTRALEAYLTAQRQGATIRYGKH